MKKLCTIIFLMLGSQAYAKGPTKIDLLCQVGTHSEELVSLEDCENKIDSQGYGPYSCQGEFFSNTYSAKFSGYSGMGSGAIRITYKSMRFSGISPIEIGDQKVSCRLP
jgi:hypothetical protein